jgi:hypothetical protein
MAVLVCDKPDRVFSGACDKIKRVQANSLAAFFGHTQQPLSAWCRTQNC